MLWTVFLQSKAIFRVKDTNGPILILDDEVRKEILAVSVGILVDE